MDRETRKALIANAARTVFGQKGYYAATVDDIVSHAKVARGTFYLYFEDKRSVFEFLIEGLLKKIQGTIYAIELDDPVKTPIAQLTDNIRGVLEVCVNDAPVARLLLSDAMGLDVEFDRKLQGFYESLAQLIARSLSQGVEAGIVRDGDVLTRCYCMLGIVKELLYQACLRPKDFDVHRATKTVVELVAVGLLTEPARRGLEL